MTNMLYVVPTLVQILVIFGCLVFALFGIRKYPKPATWLAAGLSLILCSRIGGLIGAVLIARATAAQDFVFYNSLLSVLLILFATIGFVMIVYAVFASRSTTDSDELGTYDSRPFKRNDAPTKNSNPYSTPSSG